MTSDGDEGSRGFKVVDRRPFDQEGREKPDVPDREHPPVEPAEQAQSEPATETAADGPPQHLDFASFVKSLLAAGLFQAGVLAEEGKEPPPPDPAGALQTMDTLLLLHDKTRGNLDADEEKLFPDAIGELSAAVGLHLFAPAAVHALGIEEGAEFDPNGARSMIDHLAELIGRVRDVARPDAVSALEQTLTELRLRFVQRSGG